MLRSRSVKLWAIAAITGISVILLGNAGLLTPKTDNLRSTSLIAELLSKFHYSRPEINDEISSAMLDRYIEALDPNRMIFLASDIQAFEKFRYQLDDSILEANPGAAFEIYNQYRVRLEQRIKHALRVLEDKHDFTVDEQFRVDYENEPWEQTQEALDEVWRKRVKNDFLGLRLAGKKDDKIRETLRKRYKRMLRRAKQQKANDVFQIFMNALAGEIDPHTSYFSPQSTENFNINMRLSLEGIGAALRTTNEYTQVQEIIPGGPADFSGELHPGDRIIGVAQDQDEMVDVIGWRLQDVVQLIRGPKDSVVRLMILPRSSGVDGPSREITLVRDTIKLEEQAAQHEIIENMPGYPGIRLGVIKLPTFYLDFDARARGDENYRSTTRDVRKILRTLMAESVDGIIIDLRGNGGGALDEAVELTGLFIESGPVVQVRGYRGNINVSRDPDPELVYGGPLAVIVDRFSASASEIFAGAIQDYRRGIILGEPTFGKGTVQTLIDLSRRVGSKSDLGQLKVTIAQFFRINGASTQHRGVHPDIVFPTAAYITDQGERSLDNALPWAKIRAVNYEPVRKGWLDLEILKKRNQSRVATDKGFQYLVSTAAEVKNAQERKFVSLLESKRRAERDERRRRQLELENRFRESRGLKSLTLADKEVDEDELPKKEDKDPVERIELEETARVLADYITLTSSRYAANRLPEIPDSQ